MVAGCVKATMLSAVTEERPYMHQNGGISPFFLSLGTSCEWSASSSSYFTMVKQSW